jgi:hypothetical protein
MILTHQQCVLFNGKSQLQDRTMDYVTAILPRLPSRCLH